MINVADLVAVMTLKDEMSPALDAMQPAVTSVTAKIATLQTALAAAQSELKDVAVAAASLGEVSQTALAGEMQAAAEKVDALKNELQGLKTATVEEGAAATGAAVENTAFADSLRSVGTAASSIGLLMSAAITVPIVGAGVAAMEFGTDFQTQMTRVVTLAGASTQEVDGLRQKVLDLGPTVGVGPAELAQGLFVIESAGQRGADAMDTLTIAGKMSALGMGSTEEAARSLIGIMLSYTNQNLSAAEAADILTKTVQLGNMKIDELVPALSRVNPIAAAMGVNFQDIAAGIATFTHMGASSQVAATGMRAMLSNILNDAAKTGRGFKSLSDQLHDSTITMDNFRQEMTEKGFTTAMVDLLTKVTAAGDGGVKALNSIFPNIKALTQALADYQAQGGMVVNIQEQLNNSAGTLEKSFGELQKTWAFQWDALKAQLEVLAISLSDTLIPMFSQLVKVMRDDVVPAVQDLVAFFNGLPEPIQIAVVALAALAAAAGPFLLVFGQMAFGVSALIDLFGAEDAAAGLTGAVEAAGGSLLAFVGSPVVLTVAALVAVGAGIITLTGSWGDVESAATTAWDTMKQDSGPVVTALEDVGAIIEDGAIMWWRDLKQSVLDSWQAIKDFAAWLKSVAPSSGDLGQAWLTLKIGAAAYLDYIIEGAKAAGDALKSLREMMDMSAGGGVGPAPAGPTVPTKVPDVFSATLGDIGAINNLSAAAGNLIPVISKVGATAKEGKDAIDKWGDAVSKVQSGLSTSDLVEKVMQLDEAVFNLGGSSELTAAKFKEVGDQALKYQAAGETLPPTLREIADTTFVMNQMAKENAALVTEQVAAFKTAQKAASDYLAHLPIGVMSPGPAGDLSNPLNPAVQDVGFGRLPNGPLGMPPIDPMSVTTTATSTAVSFAASFSKELENSIPDTFQKAFQGGGGISGALKSITSKFGSSVGEQLFDSDKGGILGGLTDSMTGSGNKMVAAFGDMLPAIGGAIGALLPAITGLFNKLFGDAGRQAVETFATSMGGFDSLHTQLSSLGAQGEALWVSLTQGTGSNNAAQAAANIKKVQDALAALSNDVSKYNLTWADMTAGSQQAIAGSLASATTLQASYDRLTTAGYSSDAVTKSMASDVNTWLANTLAAGAKIPPGMAPIIDKLISMGLLTDDNKNKLLGLSAITLNGGTYDDVMAAAGRYGLTLDSLGAQMNQLNINQVAAQMSADWTTLTSDGEDVNAVMLAMAPKVQDVVNAALKFGDQIPASMKPMIDAMIAAGDLTDGLGNKLKDDSKLNFAEPIEQSVSDLVTAVGKLVDVLSNGIDFPIRGKYTPDPNQPKGGDGGPGPIPMAGGGDFQVNKPTLFLAGEAGPERAVFSGANKNLQMGGSDNSPMEITVVSILDGREVARSVVKTLPGALMRGGL